MVYLLAAFCVICLMILHISDLSGPTAELGIAMFPLLNENLEYLYNISNSDGTVCHSVTFFQKKLLISTGNKSLGIYDVLSKTNLKTISFPNIIRSIAIDKTSEKFMFFALTKMFMKHQAIY